MKRTLILIGFISFLIIVINPSLFGLSDRRIVVRLKNGEVISGNYGQIVVNASGNLARIRVCSDVKWNDCFVKTVSMENIDSMEGDVIFMEHGYGGDCFIGRIIGSR